MWLLALAIPLLASGPFLGGHDWSAWPVAALLTHGGLAPMATRHPPPSHAWDRLAVGFDWLGAEAPWAINQDVLHPVPGRKCPPVGDCVLDFPYHDEVLLQEHQGSAGRVWIPEEARAQGGSFPVIVLLHGVDSGDEPDPPHRLLSAPLDLSAVVRRHLDGGRLPPLLVAAPSQTREAAGPFTLWSAEGFDLASFLETLDKELAETTGLRIRRDMVSVFGHSGAGCVLLSRKKNGVFRVAEQLSELKRQGIHVRLLGLMDICFFGGGGGGYLARRVEGTSTRLFAMWVEPERWSPGLSRELDDFAQELGATLPVSCSTERFEECLASRNDSRVYKVKQEELEAAFGPPPGSAAEGPSPHETLTIWFVDEALGLYFCDARAPGPTATPSAPAAPAPRSSFPCAGSGSPNPGG